MMRIGKNVEPISEITSPEDGQRMSWNDDLEVWGIAQDKDIKHWTLSIGYIGVTNLETVTSQIPIYSYEITKYQSKGKFGSPALLATINLDQVFQAGSESSMAQDVEPPLMGIPLVLTLTVENNSGETSQDECIIFIEDAIFY